MSENNCRVCGFSMKEEPWGKDGVTPNYDICPCCGVEFGYEDYTVMSTIEYRKKWMNSGFNWFEPKLKQKDWSFEKQKQSIPDKYK